MNRNILLQRLSDYQQKYPEENSVTEKFINFVNRDQECFDRENNFGHITGSAWLLDPSGEKALLTHHKKLGKWLQLGGHSDGDENTMRVAKKEAQEESGIQEVYLIDGEIFDLDVHEIPARKTEPAHFHFDVRFLFQARKQDYVVSDESNDLRWMSPDEARGLCPETSVQRMIDKWEARPGL